VLAIGADCIIAIDGDEQVDLTDDGSAELSFSEGSIPELIPTTTVSTTILDVETSLF
jgi:hypothetical protein